MCDEITGVPRRYHKRRRAELEDETRTRISEALVRLHGTIGPACTTVQAVAAEAGVQRATVYRHFPDEAAMYAACSAHWARENPLPDPAGWMTTRDPVSTALRELYGFYGANERLLSNIFRDESLVEPMRPAMETIRGYFAFAADTLAKGVSRRRIARAAIAHALSFSTWFSLTQDCKLSNAEAVSLMAGMIKRETTR